MGHEQKFSLCYTEESRKYKGALLKEDPWKLNPCPGLNPGCVDAGRFPEHQPDSAQGSFSSLGPGAENPVCVGGRGGGT